MATFDEVRESLDSLESVRTRAESIVLQIQSLLEQTDRARADLDALIPAVAAAEQAFRTKAASLDITKS